MRGKIVALGMMVILILTGCRNPVIPETEIEQKIEKEIDTMAIWQTPKTDWDTTPQAISDTVMNRIEGNTKYLHDTIRACGSVVIENVLSGRFARYDMPVGKALGVQYITLPIQYGQVVKMWKGRWASLDDLRWRIGVRPMPITGGSVQHTYITDSPAGGISEEVIIYTSTTEDTYLQLFVEIFNHKEYSDLLQYSIGWDFEFVVE